MKELKTKEIAKSLKTIADFFEKLPNTNLSQLNVSTSGENTFNNQQIAVNLQTLLAMSKIDKKQWLELIRDFGFDISLNPRASSRDILGKILCYLDDNPEAIETLKRIGKRKKYDSTSLVNALDVLLRED